MTPSDADQRTRQLTEKLLGAFEGSIPRVWKSPLYLLGLLIVAVVIVLLPVVYVGLIALTGYGLYYHAVNNAAILSLPAHPHSRAAAGLMMLKLVAYFGALFIGVILILFMIKPLFARPARGERRISFVRENEPVLFAFVERLCQVVGAPAPRRIDVNCSINAAAGFRRGFLSFFGRDLVLLIGAPLVAGLSLREFAGVLAHEFGHFSQGTGMRLTYIIGRVTGWFARVVYQRDTWDVHLAVLSQGQGWLSLVFLVARLFVWLTRRILWVFMVVGYAISSTMSRQMEFDADRHEMCLAGSKAFESATRRLEALVLASETALSLVGHWWDEGRLPESLPALIAAEADNLRPEAQKRLEERVSEVKSEFLSSHPATGVRIRRARKADEPGILHIEEPASILFVDFESLCREVTFACYQNLIGPAVRREHLLSMAEVTRKRKALDENLEAARRYWTTTEFVTRPFRINPYSSIFELPPDECLARLKRARAALENTQQTIRNEYRRLREAEEAISDARQAEHLLRSGFRIDAKQFGLKKGSLSEAQEACRQATQARQECEARLAKIEAVFALRLEAALALLKDERVFARLKNARQLRARSGQLLDVAAAFHRAEYLLSELRLNQSSLRAMEGALAGGHENPELIAQALKILEKQNRALTELRSTTREIRYPYEHASGEVSIAQYAIGIVPADKDVTGTSSAVICAVDSLLPLYLRVMGDLARIGEQVESAVGLQPIALMKEADAKPVSDRSTPRSGG